jgi:nitrite reductase/ring-hydroxylating ferredoxin subunit
MADQEDWVDIGSAEDLARIPLKSCKAQATAIAISFKDGQFGAVSNVCNHVGGPLGEGRLDGDYITCPWHGWKFHRLTGVGEPGFEEDRVPAFPVKVESGRVLVNVAAPSRRAKAPHQPHPLSRKPERAPGPLRLAGISTTVMDTTNPRFSGSDYLLDSALKSAADLGAETRLIRLNDLKFRACEGYYSKAAQACTWPTRMPQHYEMERPQGRGMGDPARATGKGKRGEPQVTTPRP